MKELVEAYLDETDVSDGYARMLRSRVQSLCEFAGYEISPREVQPNLFNGWIRYLIDDGIAPITVAGYRKNILTLLDHAADCGMRDYPQRRRYRKPKCGDPMPVIAWTVKEVANLLSAAKREHPHWLAFCRTAYETGLRRGDVLRLQSVSTKPFIVREHKTGKLWACKVRPATVEAIDRAGGLRSPWEQSYWSELARDLVAKAGLTGTMKRLRRTNGSINGGLGHANASTFRQSYLDIRLVKPKLPPEPR